MPETLRRRAEAALVAITIVWGSTFVMIKAALEDASTLAFLAVRFSIAAVALAVLFRRDLLSGEARSTRAGLIAGICLYVAYLLQTAGLRHTTASKSGFLTGLFVVLVPLLGAAVYRVWPRARELAGAGAATAGMALMTLEGDRLAIGKGDLLTVGCAAAFAAHILVLGHFARDASLGRVAVVQIATAAVLCLATLWWFETPYFRHSPRLWVAAGVTGVVATAVAFTVQTWAQKHTTANRAALLFALEPVVAAATARVLLGEALGSRGIWGGALILAGVLLVESRPREGPKSR
ncbi:MAG: DMT family transporter [Bryobacterales bacterium]|nr:DMT family transporter [Bryobacterales bacterium]